MPRQVACPVCRRPVLWSEDSPFRPFCSERCKLIDLGEWASGNRFIPGDDAPVASQETSEDTSPSFH